MLTYGELHGDRPDDVAEQAAKAAVAALHGLIAAESPVSKEMLEGYWTRYRDPREGDVVVINGIAFRVKQVDVRRPVELDTLPGVPSYRS
jgi:hypothetical protein